ncbi:MAG: serine protease [Gammaproteobacteria bacterium]|nr:serine protease [Gammaproteobacteria bacterium]
MTETPRTRVSRPWLAPLIASSLAGAALLVVLLTGALQRAQPGTGLDASTLQPIQEESNRALEERRDYLRNLLDQNLCVADGEYRQRGADGQSQPLTPEQQEALPRPPAALPVPPESIAEGVDFEGSLVGLLDKAVVLILNPKDEGIGTGFLVAPGIVATNHHVVGDPPASEVVVVSPELARPAKAKVLAVSGMDQSGAGQDFALLEVPELRNTPFLTLTPNAGRLQNVVATGFPGFLMQSDERFARLMDGDMSSVPQAAITQGVITARQAPAGVPLVVHTAQISPGNSGGPLVDFCGRVVGINTFLRVADDVASTRIYYALATEALAGFLRTHQVNPTLSEGACSVQSLPTEGG